MVTVIFGAHPQDEHIAPQVPSYLRFFGMRPNKNEAFGLHWIIAVRSAMSAKNSLITWVLSWDVTNIGYISDILDPVLNMYPSIHLGEDLPEGPQNALVQS